METFKFTVEIEVEAESYRLARQHVNSVIEFGDDYVDDGEGTTLVSFTVKRAE